MSVSNQAPHFIFRGLLSIARVCCLTVPYNKALCQSSASGDGQSLHMQLLCICMVNMAHLRTREWSLPITFWHLFHVKCCGKAHRGDMSDCHWHRAVMYDHPLEGAAVCGPLIEGKSLWHGGTYSHYTAPISGPSHSQTIRLQRGMGIEYLQYTQVHRDCATHTNTHTGPGHKSI